MSQQPMDIDPIDGGPNDIIMKASSPPPPPGPNNNKHNNHAVVPMQISEEEEARQAIEMFRGDDMSARVAAANRLEAVASVLGEQRTREVCNCYFPILHNASELTPCNNNNNNKISIVHIIRDCFFEKRMNFTHYFAFFSSHSCLSFFIKYQTCVVKELLPFVTDGTDDEDEVLLALANSLGKLIPLVGGGSHAQSLLPPLELLLTVEENSVRDAATESTMLVAAALPEETFVDKYAPMLTRLARKEWFTARISSAGLIADAYPRLTPIQQKEHLSLFAELCQDDTPMVRRVAAQSLGKMVGNVVRAAGRASLEKGGVVTTILIPLYETLSSNEQPVSVIFVFRFGASYMLLDCPCIDTHSQLSV
jgi:hypothetical protein